MLDFRDCTLKMAKYLSSSLNWIKQGPPKA